MREGRRCSEMGVMGRARGSAGGSEGASERWTEGAEEGGRTEVALRRGGGGQSGRASLSSAPPRYSSAAHLSLSLRSKARACTGPTSAAALRGSISHAAARNSQPPLETSIAGRDLPETPSGAFTCWWRRPHRPNRPPAGAPSASAPVRAPQSAHRSAMHRLPPPHRSPVAAICHGSHSRLLALQPPPARPNPLRPCAWLRRHCGLRRGGCS